MATLTSTPGGPREAPEPYLDTSGRSTPLPQYEKTPSVPFTLTLQEEQNSPGKFQLVVNIDAARATTVPQSRQKLVARHQPLPGVGYDVSTLYHTKKSTPPTSPHKEKSEWSDLEAIPKDLLDKVVPDWTPTFERSHSTASTQSRKLANIKARIKKGGKGFVLRLLKGPSSNPNDVAEVELAHHDYDGIAAELEAIPISHPESGSTGVNSETTALHAPVCTEPTPGIHEIGTSSKVDVPRTSETAPAPRCQPISQWLQSSNSARSSILAPDETTWISDTDTLTHGSHCLSDVSADGFSDTESVTPKASRAASPLRRSDTTFSFVKTPTRGLSVVGPVKRVQKRVPKAKGASYGSHRRLGRSPATRSVKRISPFTLNPTSTSSSKTNSAAEPPAESLTWHHPIREAPDQEKVKRHTSLDNPHPRGQMEVRSRPRKNAPQDRSPNTAPTTTSQTLSRQGSSKSVRFAAEDDGHDWDEVREAFQKAFQSSETDHINSEHVTVERMPDVHDVSEAQLPPGLEIRSVSTHTGTPYRLLLSLAIDAMLSQTVLLLQTIRDRYGAEPPIPAGHSRVRWTCSCGEQLYDDFVENKRGAARLLESYLNRPQIRTPDGPTHSGRTSTSSTMSSVFSSLSTASTLPTPASTYGGWIPGDSAKCSPTRLRSNNPFSVRIHEYPEDQWLLTCANEGKLTPKMVHLDVNAGIVKSDKDLALMLRKHYDQLNRKWYRILKLRGLNTIEFVQFEVHRNRFADIRQSPSMPPPHSGYTFEPSDLSPPVGPQYLLHLFKHPADYDGELVTYLRSPKRQSRLDFGLGYGIHLVEGFIAERVWMVLVGLFALGSLVFAVAWVRFERDIQGAFTVAGCIVTLGTLVLGAVQAWLA